MITQILTAIIIVSIGGACIFAIIKYNQKQRDKHAIYKLGTMEENPSQAVAKCTFCHTVFTYTNKTAAKVTCPKCSNCQVPLAVFNEET